MISNTGALQQGASSVTWGFGRRRLLSATPSFRLVIALGLCAHRLGSLCASQPRTIALRTVVSCLSCFFTGYKLQTKLQHDLWCVHQAVQLSPLIPEQLHLLEETVRVSSH